MYYVIFESQYGEFTKTKFTHVGGAYSFWKYMRGFNFQANWKRIYIAKYPRVS
jgi:hypothetical protein